MAVVVTINGAPGVLADAPIGVVAALSEQGAFAGAPIDVLWELTRPPGSASVLASPGHILLAPFTNAFTPDVPGGYRVRLVVTFADGSTAEDTSLADVLLPQLTDGGELPAPLEDRESDPTIGWADRANRILRAAHDGWVPADICTFRNDTAAPLTKGMVVHLLAFARWPDLTGGGTGIPVVGARLDFVVEAVPAGSTTIANLAMVLDDTVAVGARGKALRRGLVPLDTASLGYAPGSSRIYYAGQNLIPTVTPNRFPIGLVGSGTGIADPPGSFWFDPSHIETVARDEVSPIVLADNQVAAVDVHSLLVWATASVRAVHLRYHITRTIAGNSTTETGRLFLAIDPGVPEGVLSQVVATTTVPPGITFSSPVVAGLVRLRYTSTATGTVGAMVAVVEEVFP